ncbi:radical SAM protein [Cellulomonas soli]
MSQRSAHPVVRTVRHDPADRPLLVIWESTRACALSCVHCRAEAHPARHPRELDTEQATELMAQVASFGKPSPIFIITGGDPFERPDLFELVRRGRAMGLSMAVSPSGTAKLNRESLIGLQEAGVTAMSLSLDGATAQTHDGFRRVPGTFDRTVAAWEEARSLGMKVQVNSTMSSRTVHELPDLAAMLRERGAMTWSAFMLVPMGRGVDLGALTPAEAEDVMNYLYDLGPYLPVKTTEGHHFRRVNLQRAVLEARGEDHVKVLGLGDLYAELTERTAAFGWGEGVRNRRPRSTSTPGTGSCSSRTSARCTPAGSCPWARATCTTPRCRRSTAPRSCSPACATRRGCRAGAASASSPGCAAGRARAPMRPRVTRTRPTRCAGTSRGRSRTRRTSRRCWRPDTPCCRPVPGRPGTRSARSPRRTSSPTALTVRGGRLASGQEVPTHA